MTARLPTTAADRKAIPLTAVLDYFPDALCDVARLILVGQTQHECTGWDRSKSTDHADCLLRHLLERGTRDKDGVRHSTKVVIRALMALQMEIEADEGLPPSRGCVLSEAQADGIEELPEPLVVFGVSQGGFDFDRAAYGGEKLDKVLAARQPHHYDAHVTECDECREFIVARDARTSILPEPRRCRRCSGILTTFEDEVCVRCLP